LLEGSVISEPFPEQLPVICAAQQLQSVPTQLLSWEQADFAIEHLEARHASQPDGAAPPLLEDEVASPPFDPGLLDGQAMIKTALPTSSIHGLAFNFMIRHSPSPRRPIRS